MWISGTFLCSMNLQSSFKGKKRLDGVETIEQDPQKPKEIPPPKQPVLKDVSISSRNCGAVKYLLKEHAVKEYSYIPMIIIVLFTYFAPILLDQASYINLKPTIKQLCVVKIISLWHSILDLALLHWIRGVINLLTNT